MARRLREMAGGLGAPVWQRGYWDRIIRDDGAMDRIRQYVLANPTRWEIDPANPTRTRVRPGVD
ncbi:MAG: transposase, partial [Candidatus Dormibacteraceae bacterium]